MASTVPRTSLRRLRRHLARPTELVGRTRWLFHLLAVLSLLLTVPAALPVAGPAGPAGPALLAWALVAQLAPWTRRYATGRVTPALDALEVTGLAALAVVCPGPSVALATAFPALWSRAVYGTGRQLAGYVTGVCAALVTAMLAGPAVPGHPPLETSVLGALPIVVITTVGARHLARVLFAAERTRERDAALATLGAGLIGVTDAVEIRQRAWAATREICRMTPGLRALVVVEDGPGPLRVSGCAGGFAEEPADLPRTVLPVGPDDGLPRVVPDPASLTEAAGFGADWLCLALPASPGRWMLLGAPEGVPADAVTAIRSMNNQAALALRVSAAHRDLADLALTDPLTGLANRTAFTSALEDAARTPGPGTWVLFLDLDDFKRVNDELGHAAGDQLLRRAAARVVGALRAQDLCARLGGDEFGVLLRDAAEDEAAAIGHRLVELLSAPVRLDGQVVRVGASVGLAALAAGTSGSDAVRAADLAMYAAKGAGKNRVQAFTPDLLETPAPAPAAAELRAALDDGDVVVHYQPVVAADGGRCTAVEALVRWAHPVRGLLGPGAFLDVAEQTGLVVPLGEQVLRQACADVAAWSDGGLPVAVHVNASPSQLASPRFVPLVRACLAEHDLAPERLVVEITESTVLDSAAARSTLTALDALGVGLAVDDFGTGWSALTTLRTYPVDVVKIDRSFVVGAVSETADLAVLEAVTQMARRLGLTTVAEGVEDPAQLRVVQQAGVDAVQGYLHLPAVPADELTAWLARRRVLAVPLPR
ncbi:putative bifunctional diguanylate cyclase/phosphodiesterase [Geodermatophilus sp. SYSU D00758]